MFYSCKKKKVSHVWLRYIDVYLNNHKRKIGNVERFYGNMSFTWMAVRGSVHVP